MRHGEIITASNSQCGEILCSFLGQSFLFSRNPDKCAEILDTASTWRLASTWKAFCLWISWLLDFSRSLDWKMAPELLWTDSRLFAVFTVVNCVETLFWIIFYLFTANSCLYVYSILSFANRRLFLCLNHSEEQSQKTEKKKKSRGYFYVDGKCTHSLE